MVSACNTQSFSLYCMYILCVCVLKKVLLCVWYLSFSFIFFFFFFFLVFVNVFKSQYDYLRSFTVSVYIFFYFLHVTSTTIIRQHYYQLDYVISYKTFQLSIFIYIVLQLIDYDGYKKARNRDSKKAVNSKKK